MSIAFVFDLDGVIRHWDQKIVTDVEQAHDLPGGALLDTAFESALLLSAVTGVITDEEWRAEVAIRLQQRFPDANAAAAVREWSTPPGEIMAGSLDVLAAASRHGSVSLLTNATSRLNSDLEILCLTEVFDHIFNSSEIGLAKPDSLIFEHVENVLGVTADRIVFVDDSAANVETAAKCGWISLLSGPDADLRQVLASYLEKDVVR